ncbi:MAG: homocysteine S-methyltransferase family protein [Candidatus Hodgkinia cicadicola]
MFLGELEKTGAYEAIDKIARRRTLILDGAMGTQIQKFKLKRKHYKGLTAKGNNDALNVLQPKIIEKIHTDYVKAGADVIGTNTFGATAISQDDYRMAASCGQLNRNACLIARRASLKWGFKCSKRIFVAGVIGPTNKTASIQTGDTETIQESVMFDRLLESYRLQVKTLLDSGADLLLIETVFDTLNAKAAVCAYLEMCITKRRRYAAVVSASISDASGRTLSGQTIEAFWASIKHANPLSVGLNCALGADQLMTYAVRLANASGKPIWIYPNAGLPNELGAYTLDASSFASKLKDYIKIASAIGGCCGSTPRHIAALSAMVAQLGRQPRSLIRSRTGLELSGTDVVDFSTTKLCRIGERANVAGSRMFRSLIAARKYAEAIEIVRSQVANGASAIDINMDDAMLNSEAEMKNFISLLNSEPDLAKLPMMIDSSNWNTLLTALKLIQGRSIVNSISLKDGSNEFLNRAQKIIMLGGVAVVMAFDERGQAASVERRIEICKRAHRLLTCRLGCKEADIVFDLNTFAIATGIAEHDSNAISLIKSIKLVRLLFPDASITAGVSNLSFAFRGSSKIRRGLHAEFLRHAFQAGLNIAITNVNEKLNDTSLCTKAKTACWRLLFNVNPPSIEQVVDAFGRRDKSGVHAGGRIQQVEWRTWSLEARIKHAVINGLEKHIEDDSRELALKVGAVGW